MSFSYSHREFNLVPLSLPSDAPSILRMTHKIYSRNPIHSAAQVTEEDFVTSNLPSLLSRFSNPSNQMAKMVMAFDPSVLCSYIVFTPPSPRDPRSREKWERDLREDVEKNSKAKDKELVVRMMIRDKELNEKYFGVGYEERYWVLEALVTDVKYQMRGLGSRLVEWGMELIEEKVKREGKLNVEGVRLIADVEGERTYLKAKFEKLGTRSVVGKDGEASYQHSWFVKRF